MRTRVAALAVVLLGAGGPVSAQEATPPDPTGATAPTPSEPTSPGTATPSPTRVGAPTPVLDDAGTVVSNSRIVALEAEVAALVAELTTVSDGETRVQHDAAVARDRLVAADEEVTVAEQVVRAATLESQRADARLDGAMDRLAAARRVRDRAADDLQATERRLTETRLQLQRRVRETWMHGGQLSTTTMVLGMEEFNDVARVQHLLGEVVGGDNDLVADYLRLQLQRGDRLDATRAEEARVAEVAASARERRGDRADAAASATAAETAARERRHDREEVLAAVRAEMEHLGTARLEVEERLDVARAALDAEIEQELAARDEAAARVERELARRDRSMAAGLTAAEARAADLRAQHQRRIAEASAHADGTDVALPRDGCGSTSLWVWPTTGCTTSSFGIRMHPILRTRRLHAGMDIGAPAGAPILAVADGTVVRAGGSSGGHGNLVVIDHGEVATLSAHQSRVDVVVGQEVVAGQVIGRVGSTGLATGPHLHLEIHLDGANGTPVDPAPWFR